MTEGDVVAVVAGVVVRDGRYLVGRRPEHKRHGGLWEFPGGKIRPGEGFLDAARRELAEELGLVATSIGRELGVVDDPGSPFRIHFVEVHATGTPDPREHTAVEWLTRSELAAVDLAPADRSFVESLRRTA
jgi:mutator protein MutT